jgi:hypothetical protein
MENSSAAPEALYIVSDRIGFVGAFPSLAAAREAVLTPYPSVPCLVQRFPAAPGPCAKVWVVLYRDLDAVAFVSNARAEAERVRDLCARVGLAYLDDLDYWQQPFGVVPEHAAGRLSAQHRAHVLCAAGLPPGQLQEMEAADLARLEAFSRESDGPLAQLIRENEKITMMDCVVPAAPWAGLEDGEAPLGTIAPEAAGQAPGAPAAGGTAGPGGERGGLDGAPEAAGQAPGGPAAGGTAGPGGERGGLDGAP